MYLICRYSLKAAPLCDFVLSFFQKSTTITRCQLSYSAIRQRFPKLTHLDGEELPPSIGFDVGVEETKIPATQGGHLPGEMKDFVNSFLEQFFSIYDSENRNSLLAAYHDNAVFSYSVSRTDQKNQAFSNELIAESRNLMKIPLSARDKLLRQGKINVIAFLNKLPNTEHKVESFTVDVPFQTGALMIVVLNGVYVDLLQRGAKLLRNFCRSFTIIPQGAGFVIINDQLMVGGSTFEQRQKYPVKSMASSRSGNLSNPSLGGGVDQRSLINYFAQQTGMTQTFAKQCLQENNFDMDKALEVFRELHTRGAIPPEAFDNLVQGLKKTEI